METKERGKERNGGGPREKGREGEISEESGGRKRGRRE